MPELSKPPLVMMIDTINATVDSIPMIPREFMAVAFYVTGSPEIVWTEAHKAQFPISAHIQIDQSPNLAMFADFKADVADIETGAAFISSFIDAAKKRQARNWQSTAYISWGNYATLRSAVANASLTEHVLYWLADYNLNQQQAMGLIMSSPQIVAVQFASPGSNPNTVLPGTTNTTLKQSNCDLSVKRDSWFPCLFPAAIAWRE